MEDEEPSDRVGQALVKLTSIVQNLARTKPKGEARSLDDVLDDYGGGSGGGADNLGMVFRRHAQAYRHLRKCLVDQPKEIWKSIEANVERLGRAQVPHPELPIHGAPVLVSRRSSGRPQVWVSGRVPSPADAHAGSGRSTSGGPRVVAHGPGNLPRGSSAIQFLFEPSSPQSGGNAAQPVDTFMAHLREANDYADRKRRLESKQRPGSSNDLPADAGDKKGGGRGKKGAGKRQEKGSADAAPTNA